MGRAIVLLLVLLATTQLLNAARLKVVTEFDDYLEIIRKTPDFSGQLRVLQAVWGQIRGDSPEDTHKLRTLYKNIPVTNFGNEDRQYEIRHYLAILENVAKFDDYLGIYEKLSNATEKLRLAEAVWGQIRVDYADDLGKVTTLYEQLPKIIYAVDIPAGADVRQAAFELQMEIRQYLVAKNAQLLSFALSAPSLSIKTQLETFSTSLIEIYEPELVQAIYMAAIDMIYNSEQADLLSAHLQLTNLEGNFSSYEILVQAQLHLYWKFASAHDVNDAYLFNVAHYFQRSKSDPLYEQLNKSVKRRLVLAIDSLPSSLQYFFFKPNFCLRNKAHPEFLYVTIGDDLRIGTGRRIFTWKSAVEPVGRSGLWTSEFTRGQAIRNQSDLLFTLRSVNSGLDLSVISEEDSHITNLVAASKRPSEAGKFDWLVQLVENQLVFNYKDQLMCASDHFRDEERRFIYVNEIKENTSSSEKCQWVAGECYY